MKGRRRRFLTRRARMSWRRTRRQRRRRNRRWPTGPKATRTTTRRKSSITINSLARKKILAKMTTSSLAADTNREMVRKLMVGRFQLPNRSLLVGGVGLPDPVAFVSRTSRIFKGTQMPARRGIAGVVELHIGNFMLRGRRVDLAALSMKPLHEYVLD